MSTGFRSLPAADLTRAVEELLLPKLSRRYLGRLPGRRPSFASIVGQHPQDQKPLIMAEWAKLSAQARYQLSRKLRVMDWTKGRRR